MANKNIIVLDIETTGLDYYEDEILQLSIINGNNEVLFNDYFKPERHKSWNEAMAVNHITPDMVKNKGTLRDSADKIIEIINSCDLIVGYNQIYFDIPFIKEQFKRLFGTDKEISDKPNYDVMLHFAERIGEWDNTHNGYKWHKLSYCANYYGYFFKAHDSLEDVKATLYAYERLVNGL